MEKQSDIARLLRRLAECLETARADELEALLDGKLRLRIAPSVSVEDQTKTERKGVTRALDWSHIENQLRNVGSREEGQRLIAEMSKSELERLAREMRLPVARHDTVERLKEKIIESGIGARLSSQAIRGTG